MSNQIEQKLINWVSIRRESLVSADTVYLSALSELAQKALGAVQESMCASFKPHSSLPRKNLFLISEITFLPSWKKLSVNGLLPGARCSEI